MRQRREKRDEAYGETTTQQSSDSGERSIDAHVELREVEAALGDLSERTLMVFRKARIEGYTQKEIAAELGISVSGVEKHLLKAYARIAEFRTRQTEDLPS
jgi:RNA polymerase sigma factor (sigma-70 family)